MQNSNIEFKTWGQSYTARPIRKILGAVAPLAPQDRRLYQSLTSIEFAIFQHIQPRTQSPQHCLVSRAHAPQFISPDQKPWHQPSGLHYRRSMSTIVLCVQNVSELKQHLLDVWYGI